ncbi:hypothetical protein B484DRAFT_401322, partial [Ochromonadaceae sp. CCMP2298]
MSTVYVGRLDTKANVRDLEEEFGKFGAIKDVWIARNPPGFAFVEYEVARDAEDACSKMDGKLILDERVRVEISKRH